MLFLVSKNRIVLLMLLVCGLCNIGCERKSNIKNDVVRLESRSIEIPTEYMMCIEGTSDSFFVKSDALKWIVYLDSANCSSCSLRSLYIWHNFLDKIEKYREDIGVFFIVHPSVTEDVGSLYLTAKGLHFPVPIYLDTLNCFIKDNPHIPSNPLMHTFLLDENNRVILVGNPMQRPRIEDLFWSMVKKVLDEPKNPLK